MKNIKAICSRSALYIFYGLLAYAPLHIFISILIGANFGGLTLLKVLKDIICLAGFIAVLTSSYSKPWFKSWLSNKLVITIITYGMLTIGLALIRPTDSRAEAIGVTYNLRFLIFFLYGWLLVKHFDPNIVWEKSKKIVLTSSALVIFFGLVQYFILPNNSLTHIGYSRANGVLPAFFIDDKPNLERVMSTLRDPNSLGSYLIIIFSLGIASIYKKKNIITYVFIAATVLCLILTFSRSALIGLVLTVIVFVSLLIKQRLETNLKLLKRAGALTLATMIFLSLVFVAARKTYFVQNVVFHADQSTVLTDPNQLRVQFTKESIDQIIHHPLGSGPGTAGLASIQNRIQGTHLNEDYYLQIGEEVGLVGLVIFLLIIGLISFKLWQINDIDSVALLAALAGLMLTNLLVHIWSNEAVAYTWWGLAGILMAKPKA